MGAAPDQQIAAYVQFNHLSLLTKDQDFGNVLDYPPDHLRQHVMAKKRQPPRYLLESWEKQRAEAAGKRVQANRSQQVPNNSYGPPVLYYEDIPITCMDCGRVEVWTARQQKWWYEIAKAPLYANAVNRCRACRRQRRQAHRGTPRRLQTDRPVPRPER